MTKSCPSPKTIKDLELPISSLNLFKHLCLVFLVNEYIKDLPLPYI